jgi:hypothetical protein
MRAIIGFAFVLVLTAQGFAQQASTNGSGSIRTGRPETFRASDRFQALLEQQDRQLSTAQIPIGKKLHARGPLVDVGKARRVTEAPKRFLRWINPFAPTEQAQPLERAADVSPRAWSTVVALHPGGSAFPDAMTHESSMTFVSIGR